MLLPVAFLSIFCSFVLSFAPMSSIFLTFLMASAVGSRRKTLIVGLKHLLVLSLMPLLPLNHSLLHQSIGFVSLIFKTSLKNEKYCKIIIEKAVDLTVDNIFSPLTAFRHLHWESILQLPPHYYPTLVCEFYANIVDNRQ